MTYSCATRVSALLLFLLGAFCAQAQVPEVPSVYGNPAANCYNLSSTVSGSVVILSWTRLDAGSACDTNIEGVNQLFLIYHLTQNGPDSAPTPFELTLGKSAAVSLPNSGIYQILGPMGLSAGPNYSFDPLPFVPGHLGQWEQALVVFVGTSEIWSSDKFNHLPFVAPLYPVQIDGQRLTFGTALHGRTMGVFSQTDQTGGVHQFRAEILSGNPDQAMVELPSDFTFDTPIIVTLLDVTTSLSATWTVYDPIAARLGHTAFSAR